MTKPLCYYLPYLPKFFYARVLAQVTHQYTVFWLPVLGHVSIEAITLVTMTITDVVCPP